MASGSECSSMNSGVNEGAVCSSGGGGGGGATGSCAKLESIVTCSLCYDIFTAPRTFACFHSYCEPCIARLKPDPTRATRGYHCPLCRRFCAEADIQPNFLMNELVELYRLTLDGGTVRACTQCQASSPQWRCLDCKIDFCAQCKEGHTRVPLLRGHRLIANEDINDTFLVDKLIFCKIHNDKPLEFNCKVCDQLLCITCKVVDHDCHKTETVSTALERMVPKIYSDIGHVSGSIGAAETALTRLLVRTEEVQGHFGRMKDDLRQQRDALIARISADHDRLLATLEAEEHKQLAATEARRAEIEDGIKERQRVIAWAETSLQAAQGASLLLEIQSGLGSRLSNMAAEHTTSKATLEVTNIYDPPSEPEVDMEKQHSSTADDSTYVPDIQFYKRDFNWSDTNNILGVISITVPRSESEDVLNQEQMPDLSARTVDFPLCTLGDKRAVLEQKIAILEGYLCYRFAIIADQLWLPIYNKHCVLVYALDGALLTTIRFDRRVRRPKALTGLGGQCVALCSQSGLYVISARDGAIEQHIQNGHFSDCALVQQQTLAALEWKLAAIHLYSKTDQAWEPYRCIPLANTERHIGDSLLCVMDASPDESGDQSGEDIFIACAWQKHVLLEYTQSGDVINQYGSAGDSELGKLYCPSVCAADKTGSLLIADCGNHRLQVKSRNKQEPEWTEIKFEGLHCPWDVHFHNNYLWVLNNERYIMKFSLT